MRFGHYTVFDTPEENKHTQVYVEYDVPNNDNLTGATGTIVLTEGGQGSGGGDAGTGIEWVSISPAFDTAPALDDIFPIYWNGATQNINVDAFGMQNVSYSITVCPTEDAYAYADVGEEGLIGEKGEPITFSMRGAALQTMGLPLRVLDDPTESDTFKFVATLTFTPNE